MVWFVGPSFAVVANPFVAIVVDCLVTVYVMHVPSNAKTMGNVKDAPTEHPLRSPSDQLHTSWLDLAGVQSAYCGHSQVPVHAQPAEAEPVQFAVPGPSPMGDHPPPDALASP